MARIVNRIEEIRNTFKESGNYVELSETETAEIAAALRKEMEVVRRECRKKERLSIEIASKIIINT
ncbi:MAG: hypothetical protein GY754_04245 [bacterium]|nr:hypothetical protein [bacterium]